MKNFIKKYPKRIIFTALIVLLVAVIGTVNNYQTYRDVREKEHYLDDIIVEFMREIYGDITIKNYGYGYTQLYYNGELLGKRVNFRNTDSKLLEVKIDSDSYANDDTITVTVENKLLNDISFYTGKYRLWIYTEVDERYYDVYGGITAVKDKGELICLNKGESYENKIQLDSLKNSSDKPITLIPGTYILSIPLFVNNNPEFSDEEDDWFAFEFEIK